MDETLNKQHIKDNLVENALKALCKEENPILKDLLIQADKLVNKVDQYSKNELQIIDELKKKSTISQKVLLLDRYSQTHNNITLDEIYQEIYKELQIFQQRLDTFLNRRILLSYVDKKGHVYARDEQFSADLYSQVTARHGEKGGSAQLTVGKFFNTIPQQNAEMDQLNRSLARSADQKRVIYEILLKRRNSESKHLHKEKGATNYHFGFYYYNKNDINFLGPIHSNGNIAEGYAEAVINDDKRINSFNSKINKYSTSYQGAGNERKVYLLYQNYVQSKSSNNIKDIVKGDIVPTPNANPDEGFQKLIKKYNLQFAIKSGGLFSLERFGQYYIFAENLLLLYGLDKKLTPKDLLKNNSILIEKLASRELINSIYKDSIEYSKENISILLNNIQNNIK